MTEQVTYQLTFQGPMPEGQVNVGDHLALHLTATVATIQGDLGDVTAFGRDTEYELGGITVHLYANTALVNGVAAQAEPPEHVLCPECGTDRGLALAATKARDLLAGYTVSDQQSFQAWETLNEALG